MDADGNYGYIKDGADTVIPFKIYSDNEEIIVIHWFYEAACFVIKQREVSYMALTTATQTDCINVTAVMSGNYAIISALQDCHVTIIGAVNSNSVSTNILVDADFTQGDEILRPKSGANIVIFSYNL